MRGNSELGLAEKCGISEVDQHLHRDRITNQRAKRTFQCVLGELPDGVFVRYSDSESPHLWFRQTLFPWSHEGYRVPVSCGLDESVSVLTPASTVNALREGHSPVVSLDVAMFLGEW
ncbi:hypothetical protein [Thalassoglobus neptunius]|uniref:hypothetical protein n=1 Tax=Thalassoglobus neptunius TaxID=1938619 RepID=UPI0011B369FA|nr:hypothetical protein [Thalassoglobus neptunius]